MSHDAFMFIDNSEEQSSRQTSAEFVSIIMFSPVIELCERFLFCFIHFLYLSGITCVPYVSNDNTDGQCDEIDEHSEVRILQFSELILFSQPSHHGFFRYSILCLFLIFFAFQ